MSKPKPEYVLAKVLKPTYEEDTNRLLIPLIGIPDTCMMEATICYHLFRHGYSLREVKEMRRVPSSWTKRAIVAYVESHGEAEYPEGWYTPWWMLSRAQEVAIEKA